MGFLRDKLTIEGRAAKPPPGAALLFKKCPACTRDRRHVLWVTTGLFAKRFFLICLNGPREWMEESCYGHHETTRAIADFLIRLGSAREFASCPTCKHAGMLSLVVTDAGKRWEECGACRWDSRDTVVASPATRSTRTDPGALVITSDEKEAMLRSYLGDSLDVVRAPEARQLKEAVNRLGSENSDEVTELLLRRALNLLQRGWTSRAQARAADGSPVPESSIDAAAFSLEGALSRAEFEAGATGTMAITQCFQAVDRALKRLHPTIDQLPEIATLLKDPSGISAEVSYWPTVNDHLGQDAVIALVEAALKLDE